MAYSYSSNLTYFSCLADGQCKQADSAVNAYYCFCIIIPNT